MTVLQQTGLKRCPFVQLCQRRQEKRCAGKNLYADTSATEGLGEDSGNMEAISGIMDIEGFCDGILDVLQDGVYISDRTGKTLKINRMYEQLTGLKKEELVGRNVIDLVKEGKYDVALNPEIVRTGLPQSSVQTNKIGKKVILSGYPVFDKSGQVALVVTFVRDITRLTQLQEQMALQQEVLDRFCNGAQYVSKKTAAHSYAEIRNPNMLKLINLMDMMSKTDATVLILGETGVGKGVAARRIHENSSRSRMPFFKVDCTTIPENLVESELFGYESGAFSGAHSKGKPGLFEMANKGTLFLDEIGELSLAAQAKLLRAIQDQEIMRVGSTTVQKVDVRFIAATNRNLLEAVEKGTFRRDLYYRLRVAVLEIPPLRERREDILSLAHHFLDIYNHKYKKRVRLSKEAAAVLAQYKWPGNVREMENFIQSMIVIRQEETIDVSDLPMYMFSSGTCADQGGATLHEIMAEVEKDLLRKALQSKGSVAAVADCFKVDRTTIFRKLKKYSLI